MSELSYIPSISREQAKEKGIKFWYNRKSPNEVSSISCCVSVGSLISGPAAVAGACIGVTAMHQSGQRKLQLYGNKKPRLVDGVNVLPGDG